MICLVRNKFIFIRVISSVLALIGIIGHACAQDRWKRDWEKTVEAAKKEGQVNVYIGGWGAVLEAGAFQKAYPDIKVIAVTGPPTPMQLKSSLTGSCPVRDNPPFRKHWQNLGKGLQILSGSIFQRTM